MGQEIDKISLDHFHHVVPESKEVFKGRNRNYIDRGMFKGTRSTLQASIIRKGTI